MDCRKADQIAVIRLESRENDEVLGSTLMELEISIQAEERPEGVSLLTSDEFPGLAAQGRIVAGALEIARDVLPGNCSKRGTS
jgi:hypothetical protein